MESMDINIYMMMNGYVLNVVLKILKRILNVGDVERINNMTHRCKDCGSFNVVETEVYFVWCREGTMLRNRILHIWIENDWYYARLEKPSPDVVGFGKGKIEAVIYLKEALAPHKIELLGRSFDDD